jgi:hypothetical protein
MSGVLCDVLRLPVIGKTLCPTSAPRFDHMKTREPLLREFYLKRLFGHGLAGLLAAPFLLAACLAQVSVPLYHNDRQRSGHNTEETRLTPHNVNVKHFGKLFSQPVDGYIYAQPLYQEDVVLANKSVHNVVFVATMNDSVYAFDADSNTGGNAKPLWQAIFINPSLGITPVPTADVGCSDIITPEIGILSTPVLHPIGGTLYVLARTKESGQYVQRLHALDIGSGAEKFGGPVVIQASVPGTGSGSSGGVIHFQPLIQNQRSALLLQGGLVYIAWGSHCDAGAYHGWLMAYGATTLQPAGVWVTTPNGSRGAIWESGNGPAGDASDHVYVAIGNGTFDVNNSGIDYGQSIVKLSTPTQGTFSVLDYFTPYNALNLDPEDMDIGSGGAALLPNQDSGPNIHLLVQADKEGTIYLVNRDQMGHYNPNNNDQIVQWIPKAELGMWNSPALLDNTVYLGANGDYLKAFSFKSSTGLLSVTPASQTTNTFGYPGTTPSISSDKHRNGIVWALDNSSYKNTSGAVLYAYDAANLATELYSSNQDAARDNPGPAVKFAVPTVANGRVYVGTQTQLSVFGLGSAAPVSTVAPAANAPRTGPD